MVAPGVQDGSVDELACTMPPIAETRNMFWDAAEQQVSLVVPVRMEAAITSVVVVAMFVSALGRSSRVKRSPDVEDGAAIE